MFNQIARQTTVAEKILTEIFLLVKLHNHQSVYNVSAAELTEIAANLRQQYSDDVLEAAKVEIVKYYANKALTIGTFLEKCAEHGKLQRNIESTAKYLTPYKDRQKDVAQENIIEIKLMLDEAKAIKRLPYDKKFRVKGNGDAAVIEEPQPEPWVPTAYSHGPSLYAKCVAVNAIAPIESVMDPELRDLYQRGWNQGLTKDEKARFRDLGGIA